MTTLFRALRRLIRAPGFALATMAMMALGIGASTVMFSVVDAVLLEPLSPDASRIVVMYRIGQGKPISLLDLGDWREQSTSFEEIAAFGIQSGIQSVGADSGLQEARGVLVTASFFDAVGVAPFLGRGFREDEERPEADRVAVISYGLWQSAFGGDRGVLGRRMALDVGTFTTIVGVMPAGFEFPRRTQLWLVARHESPIDRRGWDFMLAVGKLAPHASSEQARLEIQAIDARVWEETRPTAYESEIEAVALSDFALKRETRSTIALILAAVALLTLVTVVNVMSFSLVRASARRREVAIRAALGATGPQRVLESIEEIAVVCFAGGALGLGLARLGLSLFLALAPDQVPRLQQATIDLRAGLFAVLLTLIAAVVVALAPAVAAMRWSPTRAISSIIHLGSRKDARLRQMFTVFQVGATAILLVIAALLGNSLLRLSRADLGYRPDQLLIFHVTGSVDPFEAADAHRRLLRELLPKLEAIPAVRSAATVSGPPLPGGWDVWFVTESQGFGLEPQERVDRDTGERRVFHDPPPEKVDQNPLVNYESISGDYFRTMGILLREGRTFDDRDAEDAPRVVIVNESFAERLWPGQSAIGKRMLTYGHARDEDGRAVWQVVVGVVADARYREIETAHLDVYVPYEQARNLVPSSFALRTAGDPLLVANEAREIVREVDPALRVDRVRTMESVVARELQSWRFNAVLLMVFAGAALLLAAAGVFGVIAQSVVYRTREIAIRFSLGATRKAILNLMVGQGMRLVLTGLVMGLGIAFTVSRGLSAHLYEISAADPTSYAAASILVVLVSAIACYLPARRAARVPPSLALRSD